MRYFLKSLFLNIISLFNISKRISVADTNVYFDDLIASQGSEVDKDTIDNPNHSASP